MVWGLKAGVGGAEYPRSLRGRGREPLDVPLLLPADGSLPPAAASAPQAVASSAELRAEHGAGGEAAAQAPWAT